MVRLLFFSCLCYLFCSGWLSGVNGDPYGNFLHHGGVLNSQMQCMDAQCNSDAIYRSIEGTCNNLENPLWGSINQLYRRLIPAEYSDGKGAPRLYQKDGSLLPSARAVSTAIHTSESKPCHNGTIFVTAWGQYIAHDILLTALDDKPCCDADLVTQYDEGENVTFQGECFPIIVPKHDREFTDLNKRCLNLFRSSGVENSSGVREQVNQLSSYIDATTVYGKDEKEMRALRTFTDGMLRVKGCNNLPETPKNNCVKSFPTDYCLLAGDARVNVYPPLAALHTIFVRYHNYVAGILKRHCWSDEVIFQEARKIVIAAHQIITYDEYLPAVLGKNTTTCKLDGEWSYDKNINTNLFNCFPTCAFRFGHSMIPETLLLDFKDVPDIDLFKAPYFVLHNIDGVLETSAGGSCESADRHFALGMSDQLFSTGLQMGSDIVALNIQRGRDHGIPGYNAFRKLCGLDAYTNFSEMASGSLFQSVYNDVDDVDLYSGAMAEVPEEGGVGPTFSCLLSMQFCNLKYGDRFWYETTDRKIGFTQNQVKELKKIKLSHIICLTTGVTRIQENVFVKANDKAMKNCIEILAKSTDFYKF